MTLGSKKFGYSVSLVPKLKRIHQCWNTRRCREALRVKTKSKFFHSFTKVYLVYTFVGGNKPW